MYFVLFKFDIRILNKQTELLYIQKKNNSNFQIPIFNDLNNLILIYLYFKKKS